MNESCHTHEWVMSRMWLDLSKTCMYELDVDITCELDVDTHELDMGITYKLDVHITYEFDADTYEWVTS